MISVANGKIIGFIGENKIYIGRRNKHFNLQESALHNPYHITKTLSRTEAIALYKRHIWNSIKRLRDEGKVDAIIEALIDIVRQEQRLGDVILVCYCKPLPCHGDVVVAAIEWLKTQDWFMKLI